MVIGQKPGYVHFRILPVVQAGQGVQLDGPLQNGGPLQGSGCLVRYGLWIVFAFLLVNIGHGLVQAVNHKPAAVIPVEPCRNPCIHVNDDFLPVRIFFPGLKFTIDYTAVFRNQLCLIPRFPDDEADSIRFLLVLPHPFCQSLQTKIEFMPSRANHKHIRRTICKQSGQYLRITRYITFHGTLYQLFCFPANIVPHTYSFQSDCKFL